MARFIRSRKLLQVLIGLFPSSSAYPSTSTFPGG